MRLPVTDRPAPSGYPTVGESGPHMGLELLARTAVAERASVTINAAGISWRPARVAGCSPATRRDSRST